MFPNDTINHRYMPTLGNGHIGATVYHPWLYLNGLFNGEGGKILYVAYEYVLQSVGTIVGEIDKIFVQYKKS